MSWHRWYWRHQKAGMTWRRGAQAEALYVTNGGALIYVAEKLLA